MGKSTVAVVARNAELNALISLLNSGVMKVYDGPQPTDVTVAPSGSNHVLASPTLPNPAAGAASNGVLTINAISAATITTGGVANWARQFESDGTTALLDVNICNQTVTLSAGASLSATSLTVSALAQPLYAGQDLWFSDAGTLKIASVTANAAAGATSVTVNALAAAITNGSATVANMTINNPNLQPNATLPISAYTITAPATAS